MQPRRVLAGSSARRSGSARLRHADDVESRVAAVWADALGMERLPDEDFFACGGTSLAAVEIAARIRSAFGVELAPDVVFGARTVAAYAQIVRERRGGRRRPGPRPRRTDRSALAPWEAEIWAGEHYERSTALRGSEIIDLKGELDVPALEWACAELVRRHEILRTIYEVAGHRPRAVVLPPQPVRLRPVALQPRAVDAHLQRVLAEPLDFEAAPPWRISLLRTGPRAHVLVLVLHELICDGEGYGAVLRDLSRLYAARVTPGADLPADPPLQYREAVQMPRATQAAGARHWERLLPDSRLGLALRPEDGGMPQEGGTPRHATTQLPIATAQALSAVAQRAGATPFMAYVASFLLFLRHQTGDVRIAVRSAAANRPLPGQREVMGLFSRIVPLEVEIAPVDSFRTLLERTRDTVLDAFRHADELPLVPPAWALEGLRGLRSELPSFRLLDKVVEHRLELPGVIATPRMRGFLSGDLHLDVRLREGRQPVASLGSNAGWDREDLGRMLDDWQRLLVGALEDADRRLDALLDRGSDAAPSADPDMRRARGGDTCLHELVDRQVAAAPGAIALRAPGAALTYGELSQRAEATARRLDDAGVAAGAAVELRLEPSVDLVVAVLAVLRLRATCVLPAPDDALAGVACDAVLERPEGAAGREGLAIRAVGGERREDRPIVRQPLDDGRTAIVAWSAGVGGRPHAVALSHGTLVQQAMHVSEALRLRRTDVAMHVDGPGVRAWALAPWPYLACGASLVAPAGARSAATPLSEEDVTVAGVPADLAAAWLASPRLRTARLRVLRVQGPGPLPDGGPRLEVVREYALAEAGGPAILERVGPDASHGTVGGRPAIRMVVRSAGGGTVPAGCAGELCMQTQEGIAPTGDLGCRSVDGTVRFLGRRADQVPYRGLQLAPTIARLEELLLRHPAVRQAAGVWLPSQELLAACLVLARGAGLGEVHLAQWLMQYGQRLPRPRACLLVDTLPRRPDGSPDRAVLAEVVLRRWRPRRTPDGETERVLLKLWRKLLHRRDIGVEDNFFMAGGTFALGFEMASRARALGVAVPLGALPLAPTIADLAIWIGASVPERPQPR